MTQAERVAKIDSYGKAYDLLVQALRRYPRQMWQYRPAADGWTIHEIVVHICDSEANSYIRCRRLVAEPGTTLMAYDEMQWARGLNYHAQSPEDALELFRWLRAKSYTLIRDLDDEVWQHQALHPELGAITLNDWLDIYERHIPEHIAQMEGVYRDWLRLQGNVQSHSV